MGQCSHQETRNSPSDRAQRTHCSPCSLPGVGSRGPAPRGTSCCPHKLRCSRTSGSPGPALLCLSRGGSAPWQRVVPRPRDASSGHGPALRTAREDQEGDLTAAPAGGLPSCPRPHAQDARTGAPLALPWRRTRAGVGTGEEGEIWGPWASAETGPRLCPQVGVLIPDVPQHPNFHSLLHRHLRDEAPVPLPLAHRLLVPFSKVSQGGQPSLTLVYLITHNFNWI